MPDYVPGPVERFGRRLKLEYMGMAAVFVTIFHLASGGRLPRVPALMTTAAGFFLFIGLKKKTRDHFVCSLLLLSAVAAMGPLLPAAGWFMPAALLALEIAILEGYLEQRQERVVLLPPLLLGWAFLDGTWWLGLLLGALYLTQRRGDPAPRRGRLALCLGVGVALAAVAVLAPAPEWLAGWRLPAAGQTPLAGGQVVAAAAGLVLVLVLVVAYWRPLAWPHRLAPVIFGLLAPLDSRFAIAFALVAPVLLAATICRRSIDSDRLRPYIKHLEWHFFWWITAVAVWLTIRS